MSNFYKARQCIIPKSKDKRLWKFDKSSLELRTVLYLAGYDVTTLPLDPFIPLVEKVGGAFSEVAKLNESTERDVAKTCTYSNLYGEGMVLLYPEDLAKDSVKDSIECGALKVYWKWKYAGATVAFTGVNMAERLFKEASLINRAKVNEIVEDNLMTIYPIREWQQSVLKECESGIVKLPTGRYLRLYDKAKENAKASLAFKGQGLGTDHIQTVILNFHDKYGEDGIPLLMVHDELVFEKDKSIPKEEAIEFMSLAEIEDKRIKNFICPVKMYWGDNWFDIERIK